MKKLIIAALAGGAILALFLVAGAGPSRSSGMGDRSPPSELLQAPSLAAPAAAPEEERMMEKKEKARRAPKAARQEALDNVLGSISAEREAGSMAGLGLKGAGEGGGLLAEVGRAASGAEETPTTTRAWFPETFLFQPLVVTDERGHADVAVKVPDRLTTWRVLALAHSRQGSQAGAVASFLGTLPAYVDPVTPPFLYAGDEVRLPIQLVNTTERELTANLSLSAAGATVGAVGGAVRIPPASDVVQYATLSATLPGTATLRAALGTTDAVERTIPVQPAGLRTVLSKGGTLAAERRFSLSGPTDALPGTEVVRLKVFPGALGLLKAELAAAPSRGGVAEDAYLLAVLGRAPALMRALGETPDERAFRDLILLATQRVMRHARAPSADAATLLAQGALAHPDNPVLARVGERLAAQVAASQRPDGTCQAVTGWTLQRLLVSTADCVRAVRRSSATPAARQRAAAVTVKASGAFERNLGRIDDGYTAAAVLASGAVQGTVAEGLTKLVLEHLKTAEDGSTYLEVAQGVMRADGRPPSTYEATAMAVLALGANPAVAELGTWLVSGYSASWGWGDGRANLVGLEAALVLFKEQVPAGVRVTVERDGKLLAAGTLDAAALKEVLTLDAPAEGSAGAHDWTVRAEPPVAGLGYSLQLVAFTPWMAPPAEGVSFTTALPSELRAGRPAELTLTAALPGNLAMELVLPLAAGVQADTPSLDALVSAGRLSRYETEDGQVTLHVPAQSSGVVYTATLKVVPTLAGRLQAGPATLAPEGQPWLAKRFAPSTWTVR